METLIKKIRIEIDAIANLTTQLPSSREIALARTSFENAKMMLGKVLQYIEAANPYPESKNEKSPVIEPTADTNRIASFPKELDHIGKVKRLRFNADELCEKIWDLDSQQMIKYRYAKILAFREHAFIECNKGMMWLGMELGRIRESEEKK